MIDVIENLRPFAKGFSKSYLVIVLILYIWRKEKPSRIDLIIIIAPFLE